MNMCHSSCSQIYEVLTPEASHWLAKGVEVKLMVKQPFALRM